MKRTLQSVAVIVAGVCAALAFSTSAYAAEVPVAPGKATADQFPPSTRCICHTARVDEWSPSMHAQAIVDPVFLAKVAEAEKAAGPAVAGFCKRCHSPIGNMTRDPDGTASAVAREGVTCMFCHQVTGIDGKPANTSHLVTADQTRRAQLTDPQAQHMTEYSELHTKAEFCGGCHNVDHPTNGTHLETSYSEWADGPYAAEGVVCQDCHMSSGPGTVGPSTGSACTGGAERDNIYAMSFFGANVGQGPADAGTRLLKSAATVKVEMPDVVPGGSVASVTVSVTNKGAGHYLPTGLTEVREMWLTVSAEGADGTVTELGERRFGTVLEDAKGDFPAEMWEAVAVHSDDRIPPRGSVTAVYRFEMPAAAEQVKVRATLRYRSVPDELATKAGVENPTTEMAVGTMTVFASQAVKDEAAKAPEPTSGSGSGGAVLVIGVVLCLIVAASAVVLVLRRRARA